MQKSLLKLSSVEKINKNSIKGSRIFDFKNQSQEYLNQSGFFNNNKEDKYINDSRIESMMVGSRHSNNNDINNNSNSNKNNNMINSINNIHNINNNNKTTNSMSSCSVHSSQIGYNSTDKLV